VIGGLSLGGYMSLAFHLAHPQRTRALLIIDTGPGYKSDAARDGWNESAEKTAVRYADQRRRWPGERQRRDAHGPASRRRRPGSGLREGCCASATPRDQQPPDDRGPSAGCGRVGGQAVPGRPPTTWPLRFRARRKVVIPAAGHAANIDQPEAFNAAVLDFLARS
jgi:pimeloyl-ACP methyl ester carboxylesterase